GVAEAQLSPPRLQLVDELESGHPAAAQLAVATAPAILAIEPEFVADHVAHREALGFALPLQIGLHLLALLMLAQGLDRKSDPAFARIDLHDQRLDLVADLVDRRGFIDALVRDLRDMDQSLDTLFQLDEHAEVRHRGHLALDHAVERIAIGNALPRVRGELLYAEAHALVLGLDTQHDRLHLVAFLVNLGGMAHLARPREVGDMHEPVDSGFNLDENAEIGNRLDLAADRAAHRMTLGEFLPGIGLGLLETERDPAAGLVHPEHLHLDAIADVDYFRRMNGALAPAHLGDVNQAFNALFELDEGAVIGDAHHLAVEAGADRVVLCRIVPRVGEDLLHAQRDALALRVVLEDDHFDLVADLDGFGGMLQTAPGHVGDMQQAVDSAEIHEGAVVGDILDRAFEDHALLEHLQGLLLERGPLAFHHGAPGDHDVAARAVELENLKARALPDIAIEIARWTGIDMRPGQERRHADIDLEPALHLADDHALDRRLAMEGALEFAPDLELLRLGIREHHGPVVGLGALEVDVDFVAFPNGGVTVGIEKFSERNLPFALVVDIDDYAIAADEEDGAEQHVTGTRCVQRLFHQRLEVIGASVRLRRRLFLHLVKPF